MSKQSVSLSVLIRAVFFLLVLGIAMPAFSGPKKNSAPPRNISEKNLSDQECNDDAVGKKDSKCLTKEGGNPKKKVIKKAGTAAAAGVAGKKVSSIVEDN